MAYSIYIYWGGGQRKEKKKKTFTEGDWLGPATVAGTDGSNFRLGQRVARGTVKYCCRYARI
jgi:hypothetical protein